MLRYALFVPVCHYALEHRCKRLWGIFGEEVLRMHMALLALLELGMYDMVWAATACDEDVLLDCCWEHAKECVIDMFADEVDTSWGTSDIGRRVAKAFGELGSEIVETGSVIISVSFASRIY